MKVSCTPTTTRLARRTIRVSPSTSTLPPSTGVQCLLATATSPWCAAWNTLFAFSVRSAMAIFVNLSAASAVRCPRVAAEERFEEHPGLQSRVRWRPACPSTTRPARWTIPPQLRCLPPLELLVDHVHLLRRYRPVRFEEYIVGILCQIVGGITWSTLLVSSAARCSRASLLLSVLSGTLFF